MNIVHVVRVSSERHMVLAPVPTYANRKRATYGPEEHGHTHRRM
jgi:hypothetical protein